MSKSIKGTQTEKNLLVAFAGESQARNRYTYFAGAAKKEGLVQIADIFEETANQEKEHAKMFFKYLEGGDIQVTETFPAGKIGTTLENLGDAAAGEEHEWTEMYPKFAKIAREEGFNQVAATFDAVSIAEKQHGKRFKDLAEKIEKVLGRKLIKHIANSSVVFRYPEAHFDLVRCGIAAYGARASSSVKFEGIGSVMTVKSKVLLVKKIRQGQSISYGRTYTASEDRKVALIDMGYGEGLSRSLSSQGHVLIRGKKVPILGRVTMDVTIVDVSSLPDVVPGDEAVIIGRQGNEVISVEEVASQAGTIPYEIFCVMGKILKKKYVK